MTPMTEPQARALVDTCLRARRAARAAYGANALRIDYTTPQAEREATYRRLYAAVQAAEATLAEALDALEALL